jgi:hypothetical protein
MAEVLELLNAFKSLEVSVPSRGGPVRFQAITVAPHNAVSLAKTVGSEAILLVKTKATVGNPPAPLRLEHITVQHGITGVERTVQGSQQGTYSFVVLKAADSVLVAMFLRFAVSIAGQLSSDPASAEVATLLQRLVALLQHLRKPNAKIIQGLWAELLVISTRNHPGRWVAGWHQDPLDLHDFVFGNLRVEVKSSATGERIHRFSHRQLCPPSGSEFYLASVLVERVAQGVSVFDLAADIHQRLSAEQSLILDTGLASALGSDYTKATEHRFDRSRAVDSLMFYPLIAMPRLRPDIPAGISDISYSVRVSDTDGQRDLLFA